jgi:hypothetical protein
MSDTIRHRHCLLYGFEMGTIYFFKNSFVPRCGTKANAKRYQYGIHSVLVRILIRVPAVTSLHAFQFQPLRN